jgi:gamma-glutamylcyclotransferase (GGCT)/AIG2-like uncharacterized protein YtfP
MIKKIFIFIFIFAVSIYAQQAKKSERLFIKTFEIKSGITQEFAEKFRDKLTLYFFEEGKGKYRVLSESDIKILYKQAEELLSMGCNAEECLMQIAYAIDADIIVYGSLEKTEGKIHAFCQALKRDRTTDELEKSSIVDVSFYESQIDWYAKEIVKKLINPNYFIDESKAPLVIKIELQPELLKTPEIKTHTLKVLKFTTDDTALQTILSVLKKIVNQGDNYFNEKDYENAKAKYIETIEKIETKVSSHKQMKLREFKESMYDRIALAWTKELEIILKKGDEYFKNKKYNEAFANYQNIEYKIYEIEFEQVKEKLKDLREIAKQRRDLVRITLAKEKVLKADAYYSDYKFEEAIDIYEKVIYDLDEIENKSSYKYISFFNEVRKKKEIAETTGQNYFKNKVYSYRDKIDVYNINDEKEKAEAALEELHNLIENSRFADSESRSIYDEMAKLLGKKQSEIPESLKYWPENKQSEIPESLEDWLSKKFFIEFEYGAGHILNAFLSFNFGRFGLGFGSSYTIDKIEIYGEKFYAHLFNFVGLLNLNLIQSGYFWMDFREKIGNEYVKIDKYSIKGLFLSTDLLIGYYGFFAEVALPIFVGKLETITDIQIGIGYRIRI